MATDVMGVIIEKGLEGLNRFYSIYRAVVVDNEDPDKANGLKVYIPEVLGGLITWAIAKHQYGGEGYGIKQLTPQVGDYVYITFELGDASQPCWEYHGWAAGEAPAPLNNPNVGGIITPKGNRILYDEDENTLDIYFKGQVLVHADAEVVVSSGSVVTLNGKDGVVINGGDNGGEIIIDKLTAKLNQLVGEIESLKAQLNAHTHTGNAGAPTSPPLTPLTQPISTFNSLDYEDTKTLH